MPRAIVPSDLAYWREHNPRAVTFTSSEPDVEPCPGVLTDDPMRDDNVIVRIPWQLNEIELMHLAQGGTLWLSTWNGLPAHQIEVQEPVR